MKIADRLIMWAGSLVLGLTLVFGIICMINMAFGLTLSYAIAAGIYGTVTLLDLHGIYWTNRTIDTVMEVVQDDMKGMDKDGK